MSLVHIHYLRPPDRLEVFRQRLVLDRVDVKVTLAEDLRFEPPLTIQGGVAAETGSSIVWFTFPGEWHDIGRFHRADRSFTGLYANVLTPVSFEEGGVWHTTDLFLDVWLPAGGEPAVLDEAQLREAEALGWVDGDTARRAREEARRIRERWQRGAWPPAIVEEWTLERARQA